MGKKILMRAVICGLFCWCLLGCGEQKKEKIQPETEAIQQPEENEADQEPEIETGPKFEEYDITLMAVGDNLMHMGVISTGEMEDGSYDYSFLFEGISEFLGVADIKIINQETILGGNEFGFSGYPAFNSPTEVGDAIAEAGFNVVLHASNHSADKGITGLLNCVSYWIYIIL